MSRKLTSITLVNARMCGACLNCSEPTTGEYDYDEDKSVIKMECVNCHSIMRLDISNNAFVMEVLPVKP